MFCFLLRRKKRNSLYKNRKITEKNLRYLASVFLLFQSERPQLPGVTAPFPDWSGWSHCFVHHASFKSTRDSGNAKTKKVSLYTRKKKDQLSHCMSVFDSVFLKENFKKFLRMIGFYFVYNCAIYIFLSKVLS